VLEKFGEGGMGVVFKGRDTQLNRFVAHLYQSPPPLRIGDLVGRQQLESMKSRSARESTGNPLTFLVWERIEKETIGILRIGH